MMVFFRFKTGNGDLSVLVGGEDAIVIAEQRTVGILNTELSTSQHLRGVLGIDLLNQQRTVRELSKETVITSCALPEM